MFATVPIFTPVFLYCRLRRGKTAKTTIFQNFKFGDFCLANPILDQRQIWHENTTPTFTAIGKYCGLCGTKNWKF